MSERFPRHNFPAEPLPGHVSAQARRKRARPITHADYLLQVVV
jgi:hypothetical protein